MTFEMFKSKFPQIEPINIKLKKKYSLYHFQGISVRSTRNHKMKK